MNQIAGPDGGTSPDGGIFISGGGDGGADAAGGGGDGGGSGTVPRVDDGVDFTKGPAFSFDEATRICISMAACMPLEFVAAYKDISRCSNERGIFSVPAPGNYVTARSSGRANDGVIVSAYRCMLAAGADCAKVNECLSPDKAPGSCTFADAGSSSGILSTTCEGTKIVGCTADGQRIGWDCSRFDTACSGGSCSFPNCPLGKERTCAGNTVAKCRASGKPIPYRDCAALGGLTCALGDQVGAACTGGPACSPETAQDTCEGSVLVSCSGSGDGGVVLRSDCAKRTAGKRCAGKVEDADCVVTGTECEGKTPTCAGAMLTNVCQDGFLKTFDCAALGFAGCSGAACSR